MNEFLLEISSNLVSAALLGVGALAVIVLATKRVRRDKARFFGLQAKGEVRLVLSRYKPSYETRTLHDGSVSTGWTGETVAIDEFLGAEALKNALGANRLAISLTSLLNNLITGERKLNVTNVVVEPTPADEVMPPGGTVIALGTGANRSNYVAELFLGQHQSSIFEFVKIDGVRAFRRIEVKGKKASLVVSSADHPGWELAVIQRITLPNERVIFLCSGKAAPGSRMAAEYLAHKWQDLYTKADGADTNGDFAHLYRFKGSYESAELLLP